MKQEITIRQLETVFEQIIAKLKSDLGEKGKVELETTVYRLIPTEQWNDFTKSENWSSASYIDQGDLIDDLNELKKLTKDTARPCTYVDLDRTASILREISQIQNPIQELKK